VLVYSDLKPRHLLKTAPLRSLADRVLPQ